VWLGKEDMVGAGAEEVGKAKETTGYRCGWGGYTTLYRDRSTWARIGKRSVRKTLHRLYECGIINHEPITHLSRYGSERSGLGGTVVICPRRVLRSLESEW
jgi:hypothetical protein